MDLIGNFLRTMADNIDPPPAPKAQAPKAPTTPAAPPPAAVPEPPDSPWALANNAAKKVSKALLDIEAWRRANLQAADELDALAKTYNEALEDAKPLVAEFPGETFGPFNVSQKAVKKGYDPAALPDEVRARKGVLVLTTDAKVIDALL